MFRRKTDLVYSTLQQVQRRMTNQTENAQSQTASHSRSRSRYGSQNKSQSQSQGQRQRQAGRPATLGPFTTPQVRRGDDPAMQSDEPGDDAAIPQSAPQQLTEIDDRDQPAQYGAATYGNGILLTFPMLCVLLLLWVLSLVLVYTLAPEGGPAADAPGLELAEGTGGIGVSDGQRSGDRVVPPGKGRDILVLRSVTRATSAAIREFKEEARNLNRVAKKYPDRLYPYYGVRKTSKGGLQLFFGLVDGAEGVKKEDYPNMLDIMVRAKTEKGREYKEAYWLPL